MGYWPFHGTAHLEHLLEHVTARIFQINENHVRVERINAREQIVRFGDAFNMGESRLAQPILENGSTDWAFVDNGDLQS
jgi:hypothetical protein